MKVIVYTPDGTSFEYSSVIIYPCWDSNALAEDRYQIRISHGTVFSNSKQDYAIYKHHNEKHCSHVITELQHLYKSTIRKMIKENLTVGWLYLAEAIERANKL